MTPPLRPSVRAAGVQAPLIPIVASWIAETPGTISLGQGVVRYPPPRQALEAVAAYHKRPGSHRYVHDPGIPALREAFAEKLRAENGIGVDWHRQVVVTAGANQGFMNAVLAICDPGDEVVLLSPYYFNHEMAIALAGCRAVCVPTDASWLPRVGAIARALTPRTRAVVTVSPNNPTGAVYPRETLKAINRLCADRGIFHVSDEAYEHFTWDGARHFSPGSLGGGHTISLFSMSKSYGMASWRVGFLVVPGLLYDDVLKVQDTIVVCAPAASQAAALAALRVGRAHVARRLPGIARVRETVRGLLADASDVLDLPPAQGAFYLFPRVRAGGDSLPLAERLVREHRVAVIPGVTFGAERGCPVRISYGNLTRVNAEEGIGRLVNGLRTILGRRRPGRNAKR